MKQTTMRAARLHAIGDFRVDMVEVPEPKGQELLVKIGACGICGSDIPRIYQLGTSRQKYPLTIGHEFSGTIVEIGKEADKNLIGKRGTFFPLIPDMKCENCQTGDYAMCLDYDYMGSRRDGGFAEYVLVPSVWNFVESRNPDLSLMTLAMTEPSCVAQHAVRRSNVFGGCSIIIFGAGPIGIMASRWATLFGASVVMLVDVLDDKVAFAKAHGADAINSMTEDVTAEIRKRTGGKLADICIEGTGSGPALNNAIDAIKTFGTITLLGNPSHDTTIKMKEHSLLLRKEVVIQTVWNSNFNSKPINEWEFTVSMMDQGRFDPSDLITHTTDLPGLPKLCDGIHDHSISICKAMYVADGETPVTQA